jgi:hypothetical protein
MLNFKEYIEERIYRLTSEEQSDVHDVVNRYLELFNKDNVFGFKFSIFSLKYFVTFLDISFALGNNE